jgi:hypothetical protein
LNKVLDSFLLEYFQGLKLSPGLFYAWKSSIRFEIGPSTIQSDEQEYIEQSLQRVLTLFHEVFADQDEVLLVTDVHSLKNDAYPRRKSLNIYLKYMKHRQLLYKLRHYLLPSMVVEDENDVEAITHRFIIPCRKSDIRYRPLLNAILYEDFNHPSAILGNNTQIGYDVYFINHSKKMIFHLYDDRGCDILSDDKENLRSLYQKYNEWILNYDREKTVLLFK